MNDQRETVSVCDDIGPALIERHQNGDVSLHYGPDENLFPGPVVVRGGHLHGECGAVETLMIWVKNRKEIPWPGGSRGPKRPL